MKVKAILEPTVHLLAKTEFTLGGEQCLKEFYGYAVNEEDYMADGASLIQLAGRKCYNAHGRKNPETAENAGYIANLLSQHHYSPLEHASFTFLIQGVSRSLTHELVRHRHFSFSQESQRYVLAARDPEIVVPPAIFELEVDGNKAADLTQEEHDELMTEQFGNTYDRVMDSYDFLREQGYSHKEAAEAARFEIPNGDATQIVVTGNTRSWMEFIEKRDADGADAEIRRLAKVIGMILSWELPEVFEEDAKKLWSGKSEQKAVKHG